MEKQRRQGGVECGQGDLLVCCIWGSITLGPTHGQHRSDFRAGPARGGGLTGSLCYLLLLLANYTRRILAIMRLGRSETPKIQALHELACARNIRSDHHNLLRKKVMIVEAPAA